MRCPPPRLDPRGPGKERLFGRPLNPIFPQMPTTELKLDAAPAVAIPSRNARGRIARLGPVIDSALANHGYPPLIERPLSAALTSTALLRALRKAPQGPMTLPA